MTHKVSKELLREVCDGCRNEPQYKNGLCKSCYEQEKHFAELEANLEENNEY